MISDSQGGDAAELAGARGRTRAKEGTHARECVFSAFCLLLLERSSRRGKLLRLGFSSPARLELFFSLSLSPLLKPTRAARLLPPVVPSLSLFCLRPPPSAKPSRRLEAPEHSKQSREPALALVFPKVKTRERHSKVLLGSSTTANLLFPISSPRLPSPSHGPKWRPSVSPTSSSGAPQPSPRAARRGPGRRAGPRSRRLPSLNPQQRRPRLRLRRRQLRL